MNCKICHSPHTFRVHESFPGGPWWQCAECNSTSSEETYRLGLYDTFLDHYISETGSFDYSCEQQKTNVRFFQKWKYIAPSLDFLDVGHCDGAALHNMQEAGWSVHGFDVQEKCRLGPHTTIAPEFKASLFPRQYGAIQCREVIEHVASWETLLDEMFKALLPYGLLQIQTPRPWHTTANVYMVGHLQILSIQSLREAVTKRGCTLLDTLVWDAGHLVLAQKT